MAGWPVTYGSLGAPEGPSAVSEVVVDAYRRAGFLLTGRTNTPEFGSITVTENLRYGIDPEPLGHRADAGRVERRGRARRWRRGCSPVAHANDGGGSIRIPASCCGLVGLKPTRGRVAQTRPGLAGVDHRGGPHPDGGRRRRPPRRDGHARPATPGSTPPPRPGPSPTTPAPTPGPLRVALNTVSALGLEVDDEAVAAAEMTARLLESAGHHVERLDGDVFDPAAVGSFLNVVNSGLAEYEDIDWEKVEPHNRAGLAAAEAVDSVVFTRSLIDLRRTTRALVTRFHDEFDLLITPTMAIEPPRVGVLEHSHASPEFPPLEVLSMAAFSRGVQHHRAAGHQPADPHRRLRPAGRRAAGGRPLGGGPPAPGGGLPRGGGPLGRPPPAGGLRPALAGAARRT